MPHAPARLLPFPPNPASPTRLQTCSSSSASTSRPCASSPSSCAPSCAAPPATPPAGGARKQARPASRRRLCGGGAHVAARQPNGSGSRLPRRRRRIQLAPPPPPPPPARRLAPLCSVFHSPPATHGSNMRPSCRRGSWQPGQAHKLPVNVNLHPRGVFFLSPAAICPRPHLPCTSYWAIPAAEAHFILLTRGSLD